MMKSDSIGNSHHIRYSAFSLWDTYRTIHPLLTLAYPERQLDMIKTMIEIYEESGWLPKWPVFNFEPHLMVGDPAPIVIGDSYIKGIRGFDIDKAYEAFEKQANTTTLRNLNRRGSEEYNTLGYIAMDGKFSNTQNFTWNNGVVWGPVSTTWNLI